VRNSPNTSPFFIENMKIIDEKHRRKKTSRKKSSPYDSVPNFFHKRNRISKTGLQNVPHTNRSQKELVGQFRHSLTSKAKDRKSNFGERLLNQHDDS
jgi:hypothetical protein